MEQSTLNVAHVERKEADIIEAMAEFARTSVNLVGMNDTHRTLTFLTTLLSDSPDTFRKIFTGNNLERLTGIIENITSGGMNPMAIFPALAELKDIFK